MIRMVVSIWFALTLLCPVFCLAETGGDCSAYAPQDGDNCEAMSIGAVVEKPGIGVASADQSLPSLDGFVVSGFAALDPAARWRLAAGHREEIKPPPAAARRHALLQTFLF
jgi:hypothetical protein